MCDIVEQNKHINKIRRYWKKEKLTKKFKMKKEPDFDMDFWLFNVQDLYYRDLDNQIPDKPHIKNGWVLIEENFIKNYLTLIKPPKNIKKNKPKTTTKTKKNKKEI